jgi:hypothetical protein
VHEPRAETAQGIPTATIVDVYEHGATDEEMVQKIRTLVLTDEEEEERARRIMVIRDHPRPHSLTYTAACHH